MKLLSHQFFNRIAELYYSDKLLLSISQEIQPAEELRLLDIPCGTGSLYNICMPCLYHGVDIDEERVSICSQRCHNGYFSRGDAATLDFENTYFDIILAAGLFHHVNDELACKILKEFDRVLKPTGRIVIFDATWPTNKYNVIGWLGRFLDEGKYVRSRQEYQPLFKRHFQIIKQSYPMRLGFDYILATLKKIENILSE